VWFPQTKWLVTHTIWMSRATRGTLVDIGWVLIGVGFVIFIASYIYFYSTRRRVGLVTKGPYAVVRHPQYLGIFLGLTGFTLLGARPIAVVAWITAVCTYLALIIHEEGENDRGFGEQYRVYRDRVPLIVPLLPRGLARWLGPLERLPKAAQYAGVAVLYIALIAAAISLLRDRAFPT
jgi:protein-S-isoprenylcysteine O-methyltransferase Ste14